MTPEVDRVSPDVRPGDIRRQLAEHPPSAPQPFADVITDLEKVIVPGLTQWQHPDFFAWFPSNITYPSILGELMSAGLGINAMAWMTSPAATELETLMLDWMHELLGLPDISAQRAIQVVALSKEQPVSRRSLRCSPPAGGPRVATSTPRATRPSSSATPPVSPIRVSRRASG